MNFYKPFLASEVGCGSEAVEGDFVKTFMCCYGR